DRIEGQVRLVLHVDGEAALLDMELHPERPVMARDVEMIGFEQIEDRDAPLLLDIRVAAQDRALVQIDGDDARGSHDSLLAGAAFLRQPLASAKPVSFLSFFSAPSRLRAHKIGSRGDAEPAEKKRGIP